MTEEELQAFEALHAIYLDALSVCDPIEFQRRQQSLLYTLTNVVLKPYFKEMNKRRKESGEEMDIDNKD